MKAADDHLAAPRLAYAVRQGKAPVEAYASVQEVRYGSAYIAALDLLGKNPYGVGFGSTVPTDADLVAVAGFAELLLSLAGDLDGYQKEGALEYAAELFALLGDHDRATRIFLDIPRDSDWHGIVPSVLMNPTTGAAALEQCGGRAECRVRVLHRAAMVAETNAEAEAMLREAFGIHRDQEPWPDFDEMAEVVDLAVDRGNRALALDLALKLDGFSQTRKSVFPSFPHIAAARALLVAGAPVEEVRAALDRAEAEMPGSGGAVIGLGHMGPITWGGGIGSQARWEQAALRARLGEAEKAIRLLEGIDDPAYAWGAVLRADLPPGVLDPLLSAARKDLSDGEFLRLRARLAGGVSWDTAPEAAVAQAVASAKAVLAAVDIADGLSVAICGQLARIGTKAGDTALRQQALECAGQTALRSRDASLMLDAAGLWFTYGTAVP